MRKAKTIIHVNQHIIKSNSKNDERNPVLTCKHRKENNYAHEAVILDANGDECARVIYRPDNPLSCGAKVWIETYNEVNLIQNNNEGDENE
jgi:hypothetical protein